MKSAFRQLLTLLRHLLAMTRKQLFFLNGKVPWSTGYHEYKCDSIAEALRSPGLKTFARGPLPRGYGHRLDERIVEYPWFFSRLRDEEIAILDAGSILNHRHVLGSPTLENRRLHIMTLSYEQYLAMKPFPSYVFGDLRNTCFKDEYFDAVCCLSTIEHIGMDNTMLYSADPSKQESNQTAYLDAVVELKRVLKKSGTLYLSFPFGQRENFGWFQIFDSAMANAIIETFNPSYVERTFFKYENNQWDVSSEVDCQDADYFDFHTSKTPTHDRLAASRSVLCLELRK